jgi:hypothetical protein
MTPPNALRRAADLLERAHATRDRAALAEVRAILVSVLEALDRTIDPGPEEIGASLRRLRGRR